MYVSISTCSCGTWARRCDEHNICTGAAAGLTLSRAIGHLRRRKAVCEVATKLQVVHPAVDAYTGQVSMHGIQLGPRVAAPAPVRTPLRS